MFAVEHWEAHYHEVTLQCVPGHEAGCGRVINLVITGLRLPLSALPANNPGVLLSAAVFKAPMAVAVRVEESPAVGLVDSALSFPPRAGRVGVPAATALAFSPTMAVPAGEVLSLSLSLSLCIHIYLYIYICVYIYMYVYI